MQSKGNKGRYEYIVEYIVLNIGSYWVKSNYFSMWWDSFGRSTEALQGYFGKLLLIYLLLTY